MIKVTHQNSYGIRNYKRQDGSVYLYDSLPSEYLRRVDLHNSVFGPMASIRILGVTKYGQVVIEQDFVNAADTENKHPSLAEVEDFLVSRGFQKVPDISNKWYSPVDLPLWYGWDAKEDADSGSSLQGNGDLL
ncbi:MAG: hypothetical protein ACFCUX_00425, partial [Candidatus Methylacidiphilales bacterium]